VVQHEAQERDGRREQQRLGRPPHLRACTAMTLLGSGGAAMCACVRKSARLGLGSRRRRTHGLGTSRGRRSTSSPPRFAAAQAEMANFGSCLCLKSLGALDLEWRHQINRKLQRDVTE
jgi:hypothetical protein